MKHFAAIAAAWVLVCGAAFVILGTESDNLGREGSISEDGAAAEAVRFLAESLGGDWIIVDSSWARVKTLPAERWIVLCDRVPRTAMKQAVVVELDARTGRVVALRRPLPR